MGEYEDRYPEAYRREEPAPQPPAAPERSPARERSSLRSRFGLGTPRETAPAWQHGRNEPPRSVGNTYRGVGPRGYVRAPERIYEDVCDRLTDNPFIDASEIEVTVSGAEVTLAGSVDGVIALRQAEAIAQEVAGVTRVHNRLTVLPIANLARQAPPAR